jgi:hypothetical protein
MNTRVALYSRASTPGASVGCGRSRREIEPGAVGAILDLDNPQVRIKGDFPFKPLLRLAGVDERPRVSASEHSIDADRRVRSLGLWRGSIERRVPVQVIDLDENRARLCSATTPEDRAPAFHPASTQIGGDPDVGTQAQRI